MVWCENNVDDLLVMTRCFAVVINCIGICHVDNMFVSMMTSWTYNFFPEVHEREKFI
jgi:hypothetical protein